MAKKKVSLGMGLALLVALALLITSIVMLPSALKGAVSYKRAREAQREGRHSTAIKEYEKLLEQHPQSVRIKAHLAISYFYNERIDKCSQLLKDIGGKKVPHSLSSPLKELIEKLDSIYYESEELGKALELYGLEELEKTASKVERYLDNNSSDAMGFFQLANIYFDMGKHKDAEELYIKAVELQPDFYCAYINLAAVYRELGSFEKAAEACNKVLEGSKEHPGAFVGLSKLELARGNPSKSLEYALKAYEYDQTDWSTISNLCVAYHYNNMAEEKQALLALLREKGYYDIAVLEAALEGKQTVK